MFIVFILSLVAVTYGAGAVAAVTPQDDDAIVDTLVSLQEAVSAGDVDAVVELIAPEASELAAAVRTSLTGASLSYSLDCSPWEKLRVETADGFVSVTCTTSVEGIDWSAHGLPASFVLEKNAGGQWLITGTDFHTKLTLGDTFSAIGKYLVPVLLACLAIFVFWLWMFIDCLRKKFDDKAIWVITLLFIGPLGAILYFFLVKRKHEHSL